jgi:amino-acid N-acetyltransferase
LRQATHEDVGAVLGLIAPLEADGTLVRRGRELHRDGDQTASRWWSMTASIVGCAALYPFSLTKRPANWRALP